MVEQPARKDNYPNYSGVWKSGYNPSEGAFFVWLEPKIGAHSREAGVILDNLGIAYLSNGIFTPRQVGFKKKYLMASGIAIKKVIMYNGERMEETNPNGKVVYCGKWNLPYSKKGEDYTGAFTLEPYTATFTMNALLRDICRRTLREFHSKLHRDLAFVPKTLLPEGKILGLENIIALAG